jgi:hypothetical protein
MFSNFSYYKELQNEIMAYLSSKVFLNMPHDQFVSSYQNGSLGCAVGTAQALALFFSGKVERSKVKPLLVLLSLVSFGFFGTCVFLMAYAPLILAIIGSFFALAVSCLAIAHGVAALVMKFALANGEFFALAFDRRILRVWDEGGENPIFATEKPSYDKKRA